MLVASVFRPQLDRRDAERPGPRHILLWRRPLMLTPILPFNKSHGSLTVLALAILLVSPLLSASLAWYYGRPPVRLAFVGANPAPALEQGSQAQARVSYIVGNDPEKWCTNLPTYDSITYRSLYPGIDLTYQGTTASLKGTYTVAAHADPSQV